MLEIIEQIILIVAPSSWPLIISVLGCVFIYFKIGKERKQTKSERDNEKDELDKRLTIVEHDVQYMKEQNQLFSSKLDRILAELTEIKVELAKKE